jgi:hypothetical protein
MMMVLGRDFQEGRSTALLECLPRQQSHPFAMSIMKTGIVRGKSYFKCRVYIFIVTTTVCKTISIPSCRARSRSRARVRGVHFIVHAARVIVSRADLHHPQRLSASALISIMSCHADEGTGKSVAHSPHRCHLLHL